MWSLQSLRKMGITGVLHFTDEEPEAEGLGDLASVPQPGSCRAGV